MQQHQLQSEIVASIKTLKEDQQEDVLKFIAELQIQDINVKQQVKKRALREIRQALKATAGV